VLIKEIYFRHKATSQLAKCNFLTTGWSEQHRVMHVQRVPTRGFIPLCRTASEEKHKAVVKHGHALHAVLRGGDSIRNTVYCPCFLQDNALMNACSSQDKEYPLCSFPLADITVLYLLTLIQRGNWHCSSKYTPAQVCARGKTMATRALPSGSAALQSCSRPCTRTGPTNSTACICRDSTTPCSQRTEVRPSERFRAMVLIIHSFSQLCPTFDFNGAPDTRAHARTRTHTHAHTCTRTHTHTHTRTHAHTRAHVHKHTQHKHTHTHTHKHTLCHTALAPLTCVAFSITFCRSRASWLMPSPKGRLPYSIW